ncbi:MAG: ABC transporter permease [Streptosporangiaceae bacterium]|jgi:ABC-type dipeptide/oligopeptide/nickel transport system permease component
MRGADYVIKRAGFALLTIFIAISLNFFLFRVLPGNAVSDLARVPHATPQLRHALTVEFGLDKPKWEQYVLYLRELAHGNMGISFAYQQPVSSLLVTALENTIPMVTVGTVGAIVVGIATGILSAWRRGSAADHLTTNLAVAFYAFPTQFLGLMLLILFGGLLPTSGMENPYISVFGTQSVLTHLEDIGLHMILPALTLVLTLYGEFTLIMRSSMLETMGEDYVLTARAKGLSDWKIISRHVLRNALLPIVTIVALSLGWIVAGAILIEFIFSWPGIGWALWNAINQRDYPMLQGGFLILAVAVVLLNFIADLAYFRLDPRITE